MAPSTPDILRDEDHMFDSEPSHELEWQLLDDTDSSDSEATSQDSISTHDILTAPLMSREAYTYIQREKRIAQYGVIGKALSVHHKGQVEIMEDQRLYLNTNTPFSAIVCGVQGSGKSHTVSTILENMLISGFLAIGSLSKALCGLVLHYGEGGSSALPNEAAWLSSSLSSHVHGPPIYAPLGDKVTVEPLLFQSSELDAAAILSMMAVGSSESAPLYMQIILSLLRDLGENYTYKAFMDKLELSKQKFNPAQLTDPSPPPKKKGATASRASRFHPGQLTIIDLSDPFLDTSSACGLFEIVVRLFVRANVGTGKVLVVDEAHKILKRSHQVSVESHTATAPFSYESHHKYSRFSSPTWWQHLIQHVPTDFSNSDAFDKVVKLQTGQAIVLAPSAIGLFSGSESHKAESKERVELKSDLSQPKTLARFGRRYLIMKTRKRVTADGGASVLVLNR
ncbi:hypothetical protein NLJ89_g170 [Agrocybe chaxingu]|uniref:Uncharacterized protein n=1 Tax=Agrocybe chaxingu TaxID=84603 RepID=A0A9W8N2J9_9AGAR|nr:hypothetical protein NLJ89_g170 [Agrocybe chaxingu]